MKHPSPVRARLFAAFAALTAAVVGATAFAMQGSGSLETVARMDVAPGNLTVTPDGRIVASLHQHYAPDLRVVEVHEDGSVSPFPNAAWNDPERPTSERFDAVLGIQSDPRGVVWMLDNGLRDGSTPKLVGWDTRADRLERVIHLPAPMTHPDSFVNDLAVDRLRNVAYIADTASKHPALIVVDLETGAARRVLENHAAVQAEDIDMVIDGTPLEIATPDGGRIRPRVSVNPIVIDAGGDWLYFGPMTGTAMHRVPTAALLDPELDPPSARRRSSDTPRSRSATAAPWIRRGTSTSPTSRATPSA
jgi:hypothetical protein